jgi:hypothetical protein
VVPSRQEVTFMPAEAKVEVEELPAESDLGTVKVRMFRVKGGLGEVWRAQADKLVPSPGDAHPDDAGYECRNQRSNPRNGEVLVTLTYHKKCGE